MRQSPDPSNPPRWSAAEVRRALRWGAVIGLWVGSVGIAVHAVGQYAHDGWIGADTHAYWLAARRAHPYQAPPRYVDAFEYSPVFAQLTRPLRLLPFPVCYILWVGVEALVYVWLTRGLAWRWRLPVLLFCVPELALGNLYGVFSVVLVAGVALPELWAIPLLTKITPAGPGVLWFILTGRVRHAVRAVACAAVLVAVSAALQPDLWREWFAYLHGNSAGAIDGILIRCAIAAAITIIAARTGWAWLLPVAFILCTPVNGGVSKDLAMLPAMIRLYLRPPARPSRSARPRRMSGVPSEVAR